MASRILVVEDDPVSRELVVSLLSDRGFEIDTAGDGFNALRMAQEHLYDLVLIDYHLPEMDGYALARLMRSLGEKTNADMKMIAITADQFGLAARRGVDTIFDRLLSKPIDPVAFPKLVDDILGSQAVVEELDKFLTSNLDEGLPSLGLWRARGLDRVPAAVVFPTPTAEERRNIEHCFRVVEDAGAADCVLLLRADGLPAVEALRRDGRHFLLALVALDKAFANIADVHFEPGDGESWTATAEVISGFAERRQALDPDLVSASALDMRILAFMLVCNRKLELHRQADGQALVPQSSGFKNSDIAGAAKELLQKNLIRATLMKNADNSIQVVTIEPRHPNTQQNPDKIINTSH